MIEEKVSKNVIAPSGYGEARGCVSGFYFDPLLAWLGQ